MDYLTTATDWARAEISCVRFFILAGLTFGGLGVGFWQHGRTAVARAFAMPMGTAAVLLLAIGIGLTVSNRRRLVSFPAAYAHDGDAFVAGEVARAERTMREYRIVVFRIIPALIAAAALALAIVDGPTGRAIAITTITMLTVVVLVDANAYARLEVYHARLTPGSQRDAE